MNDLAFYLGEWNMKQLFVAASVAVFCLAGCSTRSTLSSLPLSTPSTLDLDAPTGPVYFLPITVLEIEGAPCLKSEVKDGAAASAPPKDPATPATVVNVVNNNADAAAPPKQAKDGDGNAAKDGNDKPKACKPEDPTADYGIKVTARTLPDTSKGFQVGFPMAKVSSNKPIVNVDSSGLLSSANTVSKDETREAVVSFGSSLGSFAGFGLLASDASSKTFVSMVGLSEIVPQPNIVPQPKPKIHRYCTVTDINGNTDKNRNIECVPASAADDTNATFILRLLAATSDEQAAAGNPPAQDRKECKQSTRDGTKPNGQHCTQAALMFRTRVGVLATVEIGEPSAAVPIFARSTALIPVVDPSKDYAVTAIARPFVQSETKLTFDKGVLTAFEGDYPSTGGAVMSLPADFIGGIFSGFANAVSLRGTAKTSEAELLKAQTELLKAQIELEAARKEAEE
jgi:hypothetical protein